MRKGMKRIDLDGKTYEYSPGDPATRDAVFEEMLGKFMPMIIGKAQKQGKLLPHYEIEDWKQVGAIALLEAMERWREKPADPAVCPQRFFPYFRMYLDLKIRATHTKQNIGYKAIVLNRNLEKRRAIPGNAVRPTTKPVDMEQALSLSRMDGIEPTLEERVPGRPAFDWDGFMRSLPELQRCIVELVVDGKVKSVDQDSVGQIGAELKHAKREASESELRLAVRSLRSNSGVMALAMGM